MAELASVACKNVLFNNNYMSQIWIFGYKIKPFVTFSVVLLIAFVSVISAIKHFLYMTFWTI